MSEPEPVNKKISEEAAGPANPDTEAPEATAGDKPSLPAGTLKKKQIPLLILAGVIIIVAAFIGAIFLSSVPVATTGDTVAIYYNESFENGTLYLSNMNTSYPSLVFTIGNSSVIEGVQRAVIGMSPGEVKTVTIPYTEAYGAYDPGLVQTLNRTGPIANTSFTPGQIFTIYYRPTNSYSAVKIINVTEKTITWDANNPLVGENLTFTIRLANILKVNATAKS